jgi:L-threonylcarbamoyladenylate synthase
MGTLQAAAINNMEVFHSESLSQRDFDLILSVLHAGGVIGFPTDTAYGLGADPFSDKAVRRIFEIKGRAEQKPILLLVDSIAMVEKIAAPDKIFYAVAEHYWPGPLTMIVPAKPVLSSLVTAGTGTIGVRWPKAQFARRLLQAWDSPITATSANRSGSPSPVTCGEVLSDLDSSIDVLVDGGALPSRTGSTLLDLTGNTPVLLREGPISFDSLRKFFQDRIRVERP